MVSYRILITAFAVASLLRALRREGWQAARDRLRPRRPTTAGPHVWLHAASNGELASVRPVLVALIARHPDLKWLVTTNTQTGVALAEGWNLPQCSVRLAPLDLSYVTRRLMRDWTVAAHITLEAEIWPHRVLTTPGPVIVLGARMSAGTARMWRRFRTLAQTVLGRLAFVSAQDADSLERLHDLGLSAPAAGPVVDLKAFYDRPDTPSLPDIKRDQTWLAASTHPGEDAVVLEAHLKARTTHPDLKLILAPRHPQRAGEIAEQATALGLRVARRSLGQSPQDGDIYLADTLGEMALWYASCGRVFIAGTLTDRGGHTPYEPAAFGCALIHGPDVRNFRAPFAQLAQAGAAIEISDAHTLAKALVTLTDPSLQSDAGQQAAQILRPTTDLATLVDLVSDQLGVA